MKKRYKFLAFISLLILFIATIVLFTFFNPENLVESIGIGNAYLIIFFVGVIAGLSFLVSHNFMALYVGFIAGGLSPFGLGIVGAIGITIGDFLAYVLGYLGRSSIEDPKKKKFMERLSSWINRQNKYIRFLFIYLYSGFFIFPKDVLCGALGILEYPPKKIFIPLFLGNVTYHVGLGIILAYSLF